MYLHWSPGRCPVMQSRKADPAEHLVPFCFCFILGYASRVDNMVEGAKRRACEGNTLCSDGDTAGFLSPSIYSQTIHLQLPMNTHSWKALPNNTGITHMVIVPNRPILAVVPPMYPCPYQSSEQYRCWSLPDGKLRHRVLRWPQQSPAGEKCLWQVMCPLGKHLPAP